VKKGVKVPDRPVTMVQPTSLDMTGAARRATITSAAVPSGEFVF
jgi:hypothetical protein